MEAADICRGHLTGIKCPQITTERAVSQSPLGVTWFLRQDKNVTLEGCSLNKEDISQLRAVGLEYRANQHELLSFNLIPTRERARGWPSDMSVGLTHWEEGQQLVTRLLHGMDDTTLLVPIPHYSLEPAEPLILSCWYINSVSYFSSIAIFGHKLEIIY